MHSLWLWRWCVVRCPLWRLPSAVADRVHDGLSRPASDPKRWAVVRGADYSYGMFLYGSVIQQMIAALGPWTHHWVVNTVAALITSAAFAAFSWHSVEKRAMMLRGPLMRAEARWLERHGERRLEIVADALQHAGSPPVEFCHHRLVPRNRNALYHGFRRDELWGRF